MLLCFLISELLLICVKMMSQFVVLLYFSYKQAYLNLTFLGFYDHGKKSLTFNPLY